VLGPQDILSFWIDTVGEKGWYESSPDLDAQIQSKFEATWVDAMNGSHGLWLTHPTGALAYIILTDQFSRNMFRDTPQAFASDINARAVAKAAISRDWDLKVDGPARQFFYMPLEHSENQCDQDRAVRLIATRMPEASTQLLHARAHREVIRKFGRFPFRNAALGRSTTPAEAKWLDAGAYGATVRLLQNDKVAA